MSVTRSSTSGWKARLFNAASQNSSTRPHHGRGIAPAMGHGQNNLISAGWNGAAMLFGTLAWMGVYYAKDLFAEIDDDGAASYVLHSLVMGTVANLVVYPFVKLTHLARGEDSAQANAEFRKYFILCTVPDALYEPTADWLSSMATADSLTEFKFMKYAQPTFNVKEAAGAFTFFGVVFGMIYYFGDKFIQHLAPDEPDVEEAPLGSDATCKHKSLRVCRRMFESDEGVAVMAALQYFIFYLTDDLFDVDWESFQVTFPQVLGMAGLMAAYTFAVDALPVLLQFLENKYYPAAVEENAEANTIEDDFRELYNDSSLRESLLPAEDAAALQISVPPHSSLFRAAPAQTSSSQSMVFSNAAYHRV